MHSVYPHEPGRLPGCPECDWNCHCGPGVAEGTETICVWLGHEENELEIVIGEIDWDAPDGDSDG